MCVWLDRHAHRTTDDPDDPTLPHLQVSAMGAGQLGAGHERVPGLTWRPVSGVDDVLAVLAGDANCCFFLTTAVNSSPRQVGSSVAAAAISQLPAQQAGTST